MIRPATVRDIPGMLAIYAPYILETAITFEYEVPSLQAFEARFRGITARYPWLVWEEDGQILGYAYADTFKTRAAYQWDADLSVYLRGDCRGRGIGRALYAELENRMRDLGYHVLYGVVTSSNEASCRFHEAMGYRPIAVFEQTGLKFGRWYGVTWYEKRIREGIPTAPPALPDLFPACTNEGFCALTSQREAPVRSD